MLVDIKTRLDEPEVLDLLEEAAYDGAGAAQRYRSSAELEIFGFESEDELVGIVGFSLKDGTMELSHLAVLPEARGKGYGRGMLLELLHERSPSVIVAETDEEAVHFYRRIGFKIESLGEKVPGVERFSCTYVVDEEEAEA